MGGAWRAIGRIRVESAAAPKPATRTVACGWCLQAAALAIALFWVPVPDQGALAAPVTTKKSELKDLHERIQSLQNQLEKAKGSRADAVLELRDSESSISATNSRLRELAEDRRRTQSAITALGGQTETLERRISTHQSQLADLLVRHYRAGESDSLRHLLAGSDPNEIARDAHYLALLARAKTDLIRDLAEALDERRRLAALAGARTAELAEIEMRAQGQLAELLDQQRKRRAVLARISDRIKAKRQEITQLRRDERRLTRLIDGLGRIIAKQKRARPAKNTARPVRVEKTPDADTRHRDAFARLKGRLRLPVPGELVHRYGTPRSEGGTTWKGVFIRARNGTEIKSIAGGRVVFSDWLRGFGNLIILDHGDGYLSVYGNNESIFVKTGQETRAGDVLAAVGNSGGNAETGLYFELRHLGQPLDPLKWLILR